MRAKAMRVAAWALALGLGMSASVFAQGRGGGMGMMGMGPMAGLGILGSAEAKAELKLTDEQVTKIQEIQEGMRETMMSKFQDLQGTPPEEMREKMAPIMAEVTKEVNGKLEGVLDKDQYVRFKQINLQAMGYAALAQEDVQAELKLTDEQKEKIAAIGEETQSAMRDAFQSAQDDRQAAMTAIREARDKAMKDSAAVLTEEQKKAWEGMVGKPFQMPAFGAGRGGRRGG
jgi:Spy/CpxP family protein refolding chaperone